MILIDRATTLLWRLYYGTEEAHAKLADTNERLRHLPREELEELRGDWDMAYRMLKELRVRYEVAFGEFPHRDTIGLSEDMERVELPRNGMAVAHKSLGFQRLGVLSKDRRSAQAESAKDPGHYLFTGAIFLAPREPSIHQFLALMGCSFLIPWPGWTARSLSVCRAIRGFRPSSIFL